MAGGSSGEGVCGDDDARTSRASAVRQTTLVGTCVGPRSMAGRPTAGDLASAPSSMPPMSAFVFTTSTIADEPPAGVDTALLHPSQQAPPNKPYPPRPSALPTR